MQKFPLDFYHDLDKCRFDVEFVVPIEHLSSLEAFFQKKLKTNHKFPCRNSSRPKNSEELFHFREIAAEEALYACREFAYGIEMYNTILDYYNNSGKNRIVRVDKIF